MKSILIARVSTEVEKRDKYHLTTKYLSNLANIEKSLFESSKSE